RFAVDLQRRLAVEIPAQRAGGKLLDRGGGLELADLDGDGFGVVTKIFAGNRTARFGHGILLKESGNRGGIIPWPRGAGAREFRRLRGFFWRAALPGVYGGV